MFNIQLNILNKKPLPEHEYGNSYDDDLDHFLKECKQALTTFDETKIKKAFHLSYESHKNRLRKSGRPFYTHPIEVARILLNEIALDDASVTAALLHEIPSEGEKFSIADIRTEFGAEIAEIVDGVSKIDLVEHNKLSTTEQLENYRKLLLSLFTDVRIILVKLADRLHNMRTLEYLSNESRERLCRESLDVYAPFANRFGLRNIKWELEDLAFKFTNPDAYYEIKSGLKSTRKEREAYIDNVITKIQEKLDNDDILKKLKFKYEITGRPKHIHSIYNKMKSRQKQLHELHDLFAIRLILDTDEKHLCYYVYGLAAEVFPPVPETFKDYIASPKKNGYASLHTVLIGGGKKPFELQIRTRDMHNFSELGVAAHFRYKNQKVTSESILENRHIKAWIDNVREIFENAKDGNTHEQLEYVKKNLFIDEIYVYTPSNEFRSLPRDSTPLDFAFDIHSEVGFKFIGAKVNGKIVPINHKLQSGDQVEIITSDNQTPKQEWLKIAVSTKAKSFIKKWLKDEERNLAEKGKSLWLAKCKEKGIPDCEEDIKFVLGYFKFSSEEDFYISIATGETTIDKAAEFMRYKTRTMTDREMKTEQRAAEIYSNRSSFNKDTTFSQNKILKAELKIVADEQKTNLSLLTNIIINTHEADINAVSFDIKDGKIESFFNLSVSDATTLDIIISHLDAQYGVESVEKLNKYQVA